MWSVAIAYCISISFSAWMLMFSLALLGLPLGYLTCLLMVYTVSGIISVGVFSGIYAIKSSGIS